MTEDIYTSTSQIKVDYVFDTGNKTEIATFYDLDKHDRLMAKWYVKYCKKERIVEMQLVCRSGIRCERSTYKYDVNGLIIEDRHVHYENTRDSNFNTSECNHLIGWLTDVSSEWRLGIDSTVTTYAYKYDNARRLVKTTQKDFSVGRGCNDTILKTTHYKYNDKDSLTEINGETLYYNRNKNIDTTFETTTYKYNSKGDKIEEKHIKQASDDNAGCYLRKYTYDSFNNRHMQYYELNQNKDGSFVKKLRKHVAEEKKTNREYDKYGNVIQEKTWYGRVLLTRHIEYY